MNVLAAGAGTGLTRVEGRDKVTGAAVYADEHDPDGAAYAAIVQSEIGKGTIRSVEASAALALSGVLAVISCENAPRLHDAEGELALFQSPRVAYRGQIVAAVIAERLEVARHAQRLVRIDYDREPHDVALRADHPGFYKPDKVNPGFDTDSATGDFDADYAAAPVTIDATSRRRPSTTTRWSPTPRPPCGGRTAA